MRKNKLGIHSVIHAKRGVVYNFDHVCLYVCQTITFERLDVRSSYLHFQCISKEFGSSSYMKDIGSRSRSQREKSRSVKIRSSITPFYKRYNHEVCMYHVFLAMADRNRIV